MSRIHKIVTRRAARRGAAVGAALVLALAAPGVGHAERAMSCGFSGGGYSALYYTNCQSTIAIMASANVTESNGGATGGWTELRCVPSNSTRLVTAGYQHPLGWRYVSAHSEWGWGSGGTLCA